MTALISSGGMPMSFIWRISMLDKACRNRTRRMHRRQNFLGRMMKSLMTTMRAARAMPAEDSRRIPAAIELGCSMQGCRVLPERHCRSAASDESDAGAEFIGQATEGEPANLRNAFESLRFNGVHARRSPAERAAGQPCSDGLRHADNVVPRPSGRDLTPGEGLLDGIAGL